MQGEKLFLVTSDEDGDLFVYLDRLPAIDRAIRRRHCKQLVRNKIGQNFLLVFDESRKMMVIVSSDKVSDPISSKKEETQLSRSFYYMFMNLMTL